MDNNSPEKTFVAYNNKMDYRNKVSQKQKADGSLYLEKVSTSADDDIEIEALLEINLNFIETWNKLCWKKGIKHVSPYEKGRDPCSQ